MAYPSETELTQLATLKAWAKIPTTETGSDTALQGLIYRSSAAVTRYLNRPVIVSRTLTETRNGNLSDRMMLKATPVSSVTGLTVDGRTIPLSTGPNSAGYAFDDKVLYLRGYSFGCGVQSVVVTYIAGYGIGSSDLMAIEQAVLVTCTEWWKRRDDAGKTGQTMQGIGSLSTFAKDFPPQARTILNSYRRRVPIAA